jgi:hypothetical protein
MNAPTVTAHASCAFCTKPICAELSAAIRPSETKASFPVSSLTDGAGAASIADVRQEI